MNLLEDFKLKEDKGALLEIEEPTEESEIIIICYMYFGGICNNDEIKQIADILCKAYLRNKKTRYQYLVFFSFHIFYNTLI